MQNTLSAAASLNIGGVIKGAQGMMKGNDDQEDEESDRRKAQ